MNEIKSAFQEMPLVQRIHELEHYIDVNNDLKVLIEESKKIQKQMINAKEFRQQKQYLVYKKEYDLLYYKILNFPFVEEYLDLLEEANSILENVTSIIEKKINSHLN